MPNPGRGEKWTHHDGAHRHDEGAMPGSRQGVARDTQVTVKPCSQATTAWPASCQAVCLGVAAVSMGLVYLCAESHNPDAQVSLPASSARVLASGSSIAG